MPPRPAERDFEMYLDKEYSSPSDYARWAAPRFYSSAEAPVFLTPGGRIRHRAMDLLDGRVVASEIRSTGHEIRVEETQRTVLILPVAGWHESSFGNHRLKVDTGECAAIGPVTRRVIAHPASGRGFHAFRLAVGARDGQDELPRLPAGTHREFAGRREVAALVRLLKDAFVGAALGPEDLRSRSAEVARDALILDLLKALLVDGADSPCACATNGHVIGRARAFMLQSYPEMLRTADVAGAAGVSERVLQLTFKRKMGTTPREELARIRLDAARRRLEQADPGTSVTGTALDVGFLHFGRFSQRYAARFGERPSDTLRRARGAGG